MPVYFIIRRILRNLKSYGLYKSTIKSESMKLLDDLGKLPFYYNGDMNNFDSECKYLMGKYPKRKLFEDQSLNYRKISKRL